MLTNNTAYKYETPYKGPLVITQCFTKGAVSLQFCAVKIKKNIRTFKTYKYDTKVDNFSLKNMSDDVNI